VHGAKSLSLGEDRVRVAPWRGDPHTAYLVVRSGRPSTWAVARCLEELVDEGYRAALTAALPAADQPPYLANGFTVHERLHLLSRAIQPLPEATPGGSVHAAGLRRARRRDRARVLEVDGAAFPDFWRLDGPGLDDALGATPSVRFRVAHRADDDRIVGYAITGRAGQRGYLQRLAVDPGEQRAGSGRALVVDGLAWLRRWGAREVLVNTQEDNGPAIALYERLGFRRHQEGLAVLQRPLDRRTP
jgi:ribosomal protein S18 acetylase RimI-like enzyme